LKVKCKYEGYENKLEPFLLCQTVNFKAIITVIVNSQALF